VAEFQGPLQEGTNAIHRLRRLRMYLGEETEKTFSQSSVPPHRIFSISYYVHCSYDYSLCMYRFRRDKDCVAGFAEGLRDLARNVKSILSTNVPMEFTRDDLEKFNNTHTHCHIYKKPRRRRHASTRSLSMYLRYSKLTGGVVKRSPAGRKRELCSRDLILKPRIVVS